MPSTIFPILGTTAKSTATLTGDVWIKLLHSDDNITLLNVTFSPCARSHWHTHEKGQILHVTQGSGWVCDKGEEPRRIQVGDVVYASPGTTHWHGAEEDTIMTHFAIGMGGVEWLQPVSDAEYPTTS